MANYSATVENVGEGWNDAAYTAKLWNQHIAPILSARTYDDDTTGEEIAPVVSIGNGAAMDAHEWAWREFCARGAGDNEPLTCELANELEEKRIMQICIL